MRNSTLFFLIILFLLGCSSNKNFVVEPDYAQSKLNTNILVIPLNRTWFENNVNHTFGSLSGMGQEAFYNFFESILAGKVHSEVRMIEYEPRFDENGFKPKTLQMGSDSLEILIPTALSDFNIHNYNPEVVLLLDKYFFRKMMQQSGRASYAGRDNGVKSYKLYFETNYLFWHTEKKAPIAWGNTNGIIDLPRTGETEKANYYQAITKAAEKLSKQGPVL